MRNRTRILIAAGLMLALAAVLAGCAATESMWYDTGSPRTSAYVYTRPGTSVEYYDYSMGPPTYYYYDPYPHGYRSSFGFSYNGGYGGHERHSGGGRHHR